MTVKYRESIDNWIYCVLWPAERESFIGSATRLGTPLGADHWRVLLWFIASKFAGARSPVAKRMAAMDVLEAEPADSLARAIHSLDSSRERNVFAQAPVALFRILPASFHSLFFSLSLIGVLLTLFYYLIINGAPLLALSSLLISKMPISHSSSSTKPWFEWMGQTQSALVLWLIVLPRQKRKGRKIVQLAVLFAIISSLNV